MPTAPPLPHNEDADDDCELDELLGDRKGEHCEKNQSKQAPSLEEGNHRGTRKHKKKQLQSAAQGQTRPGPGPIQRDLLAIRINPPHKQRPSDQHTHDAIRPSPSQRRPEMDAAETATK